MSAWGLLRPTCPCDSAGDVLTELVLRPGYGASNKTQYDTVSVFVFVHACFHAFCRDSVIEPIINVERKRMLKLGVRLSNVSLLCQFCP